MKHRQAVRDVLCWCWIDCYGLITQPIVKWLIRFQVHILIVIVLAIDYNLQQIGTWERQHVGMHASLQTEYGQHRILKRQPEYLVLHVVHLPDHALRA
ncbi:hypothetical protein D3C73_1427410 [compost metagenome]